MKILYINNFFTKYGGAENSINKISKLMGNKGHKIYHFATNKQPYFIENYEYSKYFPEFSNKRELSIKNLSGIFKTFYNFEAKENLRKYLQEIKPDIVSIHNIQYHLTFSVIDACKEIGIPVVLYIHDPRLFCPGGTLSYGTTYCYDEPCIKGNPLNCIINKCKNGSLKGSILASLNFLYTRNRKIFDKIDAAICPSNAILELAARSGFDRNKLHTINHFIENEKFNTKPNYETGNYFLYVGRLDKEKGVHSIIESMQNLPEDLHLHIVGDGYEKENLIKMAANLNLKNVKFKGYLNGEDLNNEYKNCIATVLPCNWLEVFGLTLLESFLYGKPVIASKIAAIPEIVENNVNGLLFEPKNVKQLENSMRMLYENPSKAIGLGKNGRQKLETKYNSEVYYIKYSKLLEEVVAPLTKSNRQII